LNGQGISIKDVFAT